MLTVGKLDQGRAVLSGNDLGPREDRLQIVVGVEDQHRSLRLEVAIELDLRQVVPVLLNPPHQGAEAQ